jgi:hypothetical protein
MKSSFSLEIRDSHSFRSRRRKKYFLWFFLLLSLAVGIYFLAPEIIWITSKKPEVEKAELESADVKEQIIKTLPMPDMHNLKTREPHTQ